MGRGNFERKGRPIVKYRNTLRSSVQKRLNRSRCDLGCGLGLAHGIMGYMGVQMPHGKGVIVRGKGRPVVKYSNTLPWTVQK